MNREEFGMPPVTSRFSEAIGLAVESISPTEVRSHAELDENHHTPWGVVHGGVYTSLVESTASIGACYAVKDRNLFAVGVHNATDFPRPTPKARVQIVATALFQGRTQQLWEVVISDSATGKDLARGQLRTQNLDKA
ncbi:PaaI family thioesterase [Glutamicibacter mysorens]|uniref:PaaI family thioesterase n=1 Tax=Glutamicibacter mysorens TaxID=257984 RepID=UPI0020C6985A|nr:PaaI family thioesterase [Glutamicibacter mysorens]UTM45746.1 PaaI family thioesterase [Glutamicibacter mysorens]